MIETMYNGSLVTGSSEWSEGLSYCSSLSIAAVVVLQPGVSVWVVAICTHYNGDFAGGTTINARQLSNLNGSPHIKCFANLNGLRRWECNVYNKVDCPYFYGSS